MIKEITPQQKEVLGLLTKLSNIVSNCVWMAEHVDTSNVEEKINTGIWAAEHFVKEIKEINKTYQP